MAASRTFLSLSFRHSTIIGRAIRICSCHSATKQPSVHQTERGRNNPYLVLQVLIVPQWQPAEHSRPRPSDIPQCLELLFECNLSIQLQAKLQYINSKTVTRSTPCAASLDRLSMVAWRTLPSLSFRQFTMIESAVRISSCHSATNNSRTSTRRRWHNSHLVLRALTVPRR